MEKQNLKTTNYLINIIVRHIRDFFLIIDGQQVNTCVLNVYNNVECDNPKFTAFSPSFTLYTKPNLAFPSTKGYSRFGILHQQMLQFVKVVSKRAITFCQSFQLAIELFGIVERNHRLFCLCPQFGHQIVKRSKIPASKLSILSLPIAKFDCFCHEFLFRFDSISFGRKPVYCYTFKRSQNLFETWNETHIFNV